MLGTGKCGSGVKPKANIDHGVSLLSDGERQCGGKGGVFLQEKGHLTEPHPAGRQARE